MEEKISTAKIIIDENNEITDLVREIHKSKAERVVLTFTEQTDILISPINLKVLHEAAEREGKLLIAQIIQNPTGIRNSKLAGIKTIDTPSNPTEYDWEEAFEMIQAKKKEKLEKKKLLEELPTKEDEKEIFEEKVEDSIEKVKPPKVETTSQYIDKRGVKRATPFISIDDDIPQTLESNPVQAGILPAVGAIPLKKRFRINIFKNLKSSIRPKVGETVRVGNKKKILKILLFTLVPLVLLSALGFFLYNRYATFVKVRVFVESKPVEVENLLVGDTTIEEIDFESLKIPIKMEEKTKSLSNSITATGKAYRGEKAKGTIVIFYNGDCDGDTPDISLPVGQAVTSSGLSFKLINSVSFTCSEAFSSGVQVEADTFGDEYNIVSGKSFSIDGHSLDTLFAKSTSNFTGGTKEEYTVLSQTDVNNGVEALSTTAIEEVKSELREIAGDWEIIEDTIRSEVDKTTIVTDKKVGVQADIVNLDLTIKGSATYYKTTGLDEKLTQLLENKAQEENLFESNKDLELVLGDDIQKSITVEESKKSVVKIKIVAKATIKPKVDKDQLQNKLKGMEWDEGKTYLNTLNYAQRKPEAVFNPLNYPAFLQRFPDRRGGVLVSIVELEAEE